ncbi:CD63 antigen-like [Physella acuta]|uniref:CD63 antigen-like n=1 Tax=Physella acuta TaxID=109671 RepID=UPI0027DE8BFA|nr:CD63 antigen-like [Physella acuta]
MVEGGMKCVKYLLFLFNLIFVIAGIGLIAAGAYVKIKLTEYYEFFGSNYMGPGILLIIVGVIIFLLAFFGCCGAIKENYCLTMTFAVSLGIIFVLEIAGGIAGFVLRDDIENEIEKVLVDSFKSYNKSSGIRDTWDTLQKDFHCCGANNFSDWQTNLAYLGQYPASCCKTTGCDTTFGDQNQAVYHEGCRSAFEGWLKDKVAIIGGVGIGLAFVQVVGILFACCLARAIKKEYEVV